MTDPTLNLTVDCQTRENQIGVVAIGRNEGERLLRCIRSIVAQAGEFPIVYVDSGSTDGSGEAVEQFGVDVIQLDLSIPFTAARARNAGFTYLIGHYPDVTYVQFIDGDCEMAGGWLKAATQTLDREPAVVAVCGWRRELNPELSIYNRICDVEWRSGAVGSILNFGGDVMIRADALAAVGGYNEQVIAAEDDELSIRLRQNQGTLVRLDLDSTRHDANMHDLLQWWQRARRCGYAYAQVAHLHGHSSERKFVRDLRRTWLWGAILPLSALLLSVPTQGLSLLVFARYPLTALRVAYQTQRRGFSWADSLAWGVSCTVSAFPGVIGAIKFSRDRLGNKLPEIIEYKGEQFS